MIYLGIDPGVSGGVACVNDDGRASVTRWPSCDRDLRLLSLWLFDTNEQHKGIHCAIERVWASPQMGVVSAFTFGGAYHAARALTLGASIRLIEPTPQQWQKAMNCRTGGDKSITKAKAQALFPHIKVTNWSADALLLAEYCRLVSTGQLEGPTHGKESSRKKEDRSPVRRKAQGR